MKYPLAMQRALFAATLLAAVSIGWADVSGIWQGRMILNPELEKQAKTKEQKAALKQAVAEGAKIRVQLELKKDKTWVVKMNLPDGKSSVSSGTWTQKGSEVLTTTLVREGKKVAAKDIRAETMLLSKDGKQLVRFFREQPGIGLLFVRSK